MTSAELVMAYCASLSLPSPRNVSRLLQSMYVSLSTTKEVQGQLVWRKQTKISPNRAMLNQTKRRPNIRGGLRILKNTWYHKYVSPTVLHVPFNYLVIL